MPCPVFPPLRRLFFNFYRPRGGILISSAQGPGSSRLALSLCEMENFSVAYWNSSTLWLLVLVSQFLLNFSQCCLKQTLLLLLYAKRHNLSFLVTHSCCHIFSVFWKTFYLNPFLLRICILLVVYLSTYNSRSGSLSIYQVSLIELCYQDCCFVFNL